MSVSRIHCPECGYELLYAMLGSRGSYRTPSEFARTCAHAGGIQTHDSMNCPVMRAEAERILRAKLPGSEAAK
jgi:hypothetical protein